MARKLDKIIVTNNSALLAKYGAGGVRAVRAAVSRLIAADRKRGLNSRLIALDDARLMRSFSARPVSHGGSARQNKQAIDDLYTAIAPDYILLLGSIDVIPQQPLHNPLYSTPGGDDSDAHAAGDLPYACEASYSQDVTKFIGPTRVVGRLPDMAGAREPSFLLQVIAVACKAKQLQRKDYQSPFAITAQIWESSTRQSMRNIFGASDGIQPVPPRSSRWAPQLLKRRMHLINCHGANHASEFFGQPANGAYQYPIALKASYINGQLTPGTVAAAECCYGGQLSRISETQARIGICETYLKNGSWGFLGSSSIAYGDFERNAEADLMCQYFLESVLSGASLGRALIEARHKYIRVASPLDPVDLKTLAQFSLYGDPSIVAVDPVEGGSRRLAATDPKFIRAQRSERHDRRRTLFKQGVTFASHEPVTRKTRPTQAARIKRSLFAKARQWKLAPERIQSFAIHYRASAPRMPAGLEANSALPSAYHVLFCRARAKKRVAAGGESGVPDIAALIAQEVNGELVSFARTQSR